MTNDIEGFILAGGANSRIGRRKASLKLGGRSLIEIAQSDLSAITDDIRVVGEKSADDVADGLEWIADIRSGEKSSLLGLTTALANCKKAWAFVLACDMPFVTGALVERIAPFRDDIVDAVVPVQADGRLQPLCAMYRRDACLEKAMEMLKAGKRSLHSLIDYLNAKRIEFDEIADLDGSELFFTNINTPEDFERAKNLYA
jgi:molybdopterin-guanine dinucleotide biosynthesis protein A